MQAQKKMNSAGEQPQQTGRFVVIVTEAEKNVVREDADRIRLGKMLDRLMRGETTECL